MKQLSVIVLLLCLSGFAFGQVPVNGKVTRTNGDSVNGAKVYIYPDTASNPPAFATMVDTTNTTGNFSFILPASVPNGTVFYVSTLDCDSVNYKTNTHIFTGGLVVSNLVICVTAPTNFSGYVFLGSSAKRPPPQEAMVYLISKCAGNVLTYIDSVETDTNGYFRVDSFPKLSAGCELIMKARLLPVSSEYEKYLPAYHKSNTNYSLRWSGARDIPLQVARGGINIVLPEAINPHGGPSSIRGYAKDEITASRLPDKVLFITDMNDVTVDYTFTNNFGNFGFTNLPFGTYKVFGDVWGKDNPDLVVKVSAEVVNVFNIIFYENDTVFWGTIATSIAGNKELLPELSLYPNPAAEYVYLNGSEHISGEKQVVLTDVAGREVQTLVFKSQETIKISMGTLPPGVYILQLNTGQGTVVFRIVK